MIHMLERSQSISWKAQITTNEIRFVSPKAQLLAPRVRSDTYFIALFEKRSSSPLTVPADRLTAKEPAYCTYFELVWVEYQIRSKRRLLRCIWVQEDVG